MFVANVHRFPQLLRTGACAVRTRCGHEAYVGWSAQCRSAEEARRYVYVDGGPVALDEPTSPDGTVLETDEVMECPDETPTGEVCLPVVYTTPELTDPLDVEEMAVAAVG